MLSLSEIAKALGGIDGWQVAASTMSAEELLQLYR